jgi:hypothetical protein
VAVEVAGDHLNGGDVDGGGRRFGRDRDSPERACGVKLKRGIDDAVEYMTTGKIWWVEMERW